MSPLFDLAVCAEMAFRDLPFVERVRRIHDLGFQVEMWDWSTKDIASLLDTGATSSSMTGYLSGSLADEDGAAELLRTAEESIAVADRLGCPRLNLHGTGLNEQGLPVRPVHEVTGAMWLRAEKTLRAVAGLGERAGVMFCLENLNTEVDHPGVPFARAADTLALVEAVDSPHLRMMFDVYHAQIGEGNLIRLLERAGPAIGRCKWRTSRVDVSPAPVRSTIRRSRGPWSVSDIPAWLASKPKHRPTMPAPWRCSAARSVS